jgi:antitoxin component of RelBE/YafQ-DinJ toxin-antitoxin module
MVKKTNDRMGLSINSTIKRQFTAVCALKGLNMSEVVEALMAKWLEENATPKLLAALSEEEEAPSPTKSKRDK